MNQKMSVKAGVSAVAIAALIAVGGVSSAQALQDPRAIATDGRIKTVRFSPNEVYKFTGHYGYQSIIKFAADEEILTVSVGDSVAWALNPVGSRLFLKPVEPDAMTNLTVVTNQREYHFELHAEETDNIRDKAMTFVMRFVYPEQYGAGFASTMEGGVPDLSNPEVRANLNFKYSIVGSDKISPLRIFDDGEFTYFQFRNKNADVPAFFLVDPTGDESIINFRTRGDYIVVERVAPRFTLRHGADILCVFNEIMTLGPKPVPIDNRTWLGKTVDFFKFDK